MIPKKIHYCWFGNNPKPELVLKCIESWKKHCPDWKIIEWNESNFDIYQHPFMKSAYEAKKWAFVSDVARLLIVYTHGGVYMDTDVELVSSLEEQIAYDSFFAYDNIVSIATGLGFGAIPGHKFVKSMISCYDDMEFDINKAVACPVLNTNGIRRCCPDLEMNGAETIVFENNAFYSCYDVWKFANHHGMQSWVEGIKETKKKRKRTKLSLKIQKFFKTHKKFMYIEKHFGSKGLKIYTFFVYDFFDCGPWFFIKRALYKLKKKFISKNTEEK